jgi:hypothetical protein
MERDAPEPRLFGPYTRSHFTDIGVPSCFSPGGSSEDVNGYGFSRGLSPATARPLL